MTHQCTEASFLKDVANHKMTVISDNGVNRHIRFGSEDSRSFWFDLITWNGTLCIDGDCGTYVFRRLEDMFLFFRADLEHQQKSGQSLYINKGYWGEKLQSIAKQGGYEEFSEDLFTQHVTNYFNAWVEESRPEEDAPELEKVEFEEIKKALWDEIEDKVLFYADSEVRAQEAVHDFSSEAVDGFYFRDFSEYSCNEYTYHYVWNCYAIAWGILKYDQHKLIDKE